MLLEQFALEKGAYRARVFPAPGVVMDERVRMKCQIPLCPQYGRTLTCPPNVPTVEEFSRVVGRYSEALLVQTRSSLSGEIGAYEKEEVLRYFADPGKASRMKGGEKTDQDKDLDSMKIAAIRLHGAELWNGGYIKPYDITEQALNSPLGRQFQKECVDA